MKRPGCGLNATFSTFSSVKSNEASTTEVHYRKFYVMTINTFLYGTESDTVLINSLSVVPVVFEEQQHSQKWFAFGLALGLSTSQLHDIETQYSTPAQYARESILLWRQQNKAASLKPIIAALKKIHCNVEASNLEQYCGDGEFTNHHQVYSLVQLN